MVWPGVNDLKIHGPIDVGGAMFSGLSSMFFVASVDLLSQYCRKLCLGMMPPAAAPARLRVAGQKTFPNLIVMVLPAFDTVSPLIVSVLPSLYSAYPTMSWI